MKGKIVACLRGDNKLLEKGETVRTARGVGMIICNGPKIERDILLETYSLPATHLHAEDGAEVFYYIKSTM